MSVCSFASAEALADFSLAQQRSVDLRASWKKLWRLSSPFWTSHERVWAWSLLLSLMVCSCIGTGMHLLISFQERNVSTALSNKNADALYQGISTYFVVILVAVPFFAVFSYLQDLFVLSWRRWLTRTTLEQYMAPGAFYALQQGFVLEGAQTLDNPDQRISDDVRAFTDQAARMTLLVIQQTLTVLGFAGVLYSISPSLVLFLVFYALAGTWTTMRFFGRKLVPRHAKVLKGEGDFRFALVRLGEYAESVAFYRGEQQELGILNSRFARICDEVSKLIVWERHLAVFKNAYQYITYLIPPVIIAPRYLAGEIEFGVVAQSAMAFRMVLGALTVLVKQFQELSRFSASIDRLYELKMHLQKYEEMRLVPESHPHLFAGSRITRKERDQDSLITLEAVSITVPSEFSFASLTEKRLSTKPESIRTLVKNLNFVIEEDCNVVIVGSSGVGMDMSEIQLSSFREKCSTSNYCWIVVIWNRTDCFSKEFVSD